MRRAEREALETEEAEAFEQYKQRQRQLTFSDENSEGSDEEPSRLKMEMRQVKELLFQARHAQKDAQERADQAERKAQERAEESERRVARAEESLEEFKRLLVKKPGRPDLEPPVLEKARTTSRSQMHR